MQLFKPASDIETINQGLAEGWIVPVTPKVEKQLSLEDEKIPVVEACKVRWINLFGHPTQT